jgi:hypothetical protein
MKNYWFEHSNFLLDLLFEDLKLINHLVLFQYISFLDPSTSVDTALAGTWLLA